MAWVYLEDIEEEPKENWIGSGICMIMKTYGVLGSNGARSGFGGRIWVFISRGSGSYIS